MNSYFKNNIFSISFGTGLSKLVGFTREAFIAAAFGIGITYDAFNYAYIIPGFFLVIIGGINGSFHNAVVAVLTPINKRDSGVVLTQVSIKVTLILILLGLLISQDFPIKYLKSFKSFSYFQLLLTNWNLGMIASIFLNITWILVLDP